MKSRLLLSIFSWPLVAQANFELSPTLHLNAVTGVTSATDMSAVATHGHDPNDDLALQGLDLGLNFKHNNWLSGFVNINTFTTGDGDLDAEWEEGFIKISTLPGGFELRGGRFLNRFGLQNNVHLHGWNFVNSNISTPAFLGEEGLFTEGLELTWLRQTDRTTLALSGSFGKVPSHEAHGEESDPHHDEEDEDHEHLDSEAALFAENILTLRAQLNFAANDFHQHTFGLNGALGENSFGRDQNTQLFSADYVYQWRENGIEPGGREFSTGIELFYRDVEWADETDATGSSSQTGYMVFGRYRFAEKWITDIRYEDLQGRNPATDLSLGYDHERLSLALTREFEFGDWTSHARLQYSHDQLAHTDEDTLWLQLGFNFGQGEVR